MVLFLLIDYFFIFPIKSKISPCRSPRSTQRYNKHNPQSCSVSLIPALCEPQALVFVRWRCASGRHRVVLPRAPNTAAAVISISVVMVTQQQGAKWQCNLWHSAWGV